MNSFSVQPNDRVSYKVLYEDPDVVVVVKPAGLVTQPGTGHERDALLNGLFARHGTELQNLGAARDFGLLHRLDRETSGALVVARRARMYDYLRRAFETRGVRKEYWALGHGVPRAAQGVVRRPIAEVIERPPRAGHVSRGTVKLARLSGSGKPAVTAYRTLGSARGVTLFECRTLTGRLHQVRVHLASIGCPLLGDAMYAPGPVQSLSPRLALHAHRLVLPMPDGRRLDCRAAWPSDLRGVLKRFGLAAPPGKDEAVWRASAPVEGGEEIDDEGVSDQEP